VRAAGIGRKGGNHIQGKAFITAVRKRGSVRLWENEEKGGVRSIRGKKRKNLVMSRARLDAGSNSGLFCWWKVEGTRPHKFTEKGKGSTVLLSSNRILIKSHLGRIGKPPGETGGSVRGGRPCRLKKLAEKSQKAIKSNPGGCELITTWGGSVS